MVTERLQTRRPGTSLTPAVARTIRSESWHQRLENYDQMHQGPRDLDLDKHEPSAANVSGNTGSASPAELEGEDPPDLGSRALRTFIATNAIVVVRSNISGQIFEANQAFTDLLGWTQEEVMSRNLRWTDITPSKWANESKVAIEQLMTQGKALPFEKEYLHKDGHSVPVLVVILALDTTGDDWLAFILDLSKEKLAERLLKFSEAKFRHLTESIPQIVWIVDAQNNLVYANQKLYDFSGFTRQQTDGTGWQNVIHPADVDKYVDSWKRSSSYANVYEMEVRYRQANGDYKWFLVRTAPVTNEKKEVLLWIGTSTDIDEQKQQENDLKESELQYRTLADAIPQIVWTAQPSGEIDFFNHRWFEYTGLSWNQSINKGWTLLIHPEDRDSYLSDWEKALLSGDTYEKEFRLRRAVGIGSQVESPYRWHLGRAVALRSEEGAIQKWFATWTEIENQKFRYREK
jgi:PAS domain S-box-containing protein